MHQAAGRIIDADEQGALRAAVFEPPMLRAIDLDELTDTVATMARLVHRLEPLPAIAPDPVGDHPASYGLDAEP